MSVWTTITRRGLQEGQRFVPAHPEGLTVLEYHLVAGGTSSPVDIPRGMWERHLDELCEHATVLPLVEAVSRLSQGSSLSRAVSITVDDAYANFAEVMAPALMQRGLHATLFVPTGHVNGAAPSPIRGIDVPPCSWEQLRDMAATGLVDLGAHTVSHPTLSRVPVEQARREVLRSKAEVESRVQQRVRSFAYPRDIVDERIAEVVADNFDVAVAGGGGQATASRLRPHRVQRVPIRRDSPESVLPILTSRVWLEERLANAVRRYLK